MRSFGVRRECGESALVSLVWRQYGLATPGEITETLTLFPGSSAGKSWSRWRPGEPGCGRSTPLSAAPDGGDSSPVPSAAASLPDCLLHARSRALRHRERALGAPTGRGYQAELARG